MSVCGREFTARRGEQAGPKAVGEKVTVGQAKGIRVTHGVRARVFSVLAVLALVLVGTIPMSAAWATDYPSWADVAAARKSESATKAKIAQIKKLIAGLQDEVDATAAVAQQTGDIYFAADQKYQEAALKAGELQDQADAAEKLANESVAKAGVMVAQLYRSGSGDITTTLFADAAKADDLLYSYGMADKFSQQTSSIYDNAVRDQQSAQSLTDQANVAKDIRETLKAEAEVAYRAAQAAADKAAAALEEQASNENQLRAQLSVLVDRRKATEADYIKGVRERVGTGAQLGAGEISNDGWARPRSGHITSPFGYRADPFGGGGSNYHLGTDIGASCGAAIYAAHGGTVSYSGWNGVYGYFIRLDHGGGVQTEYGHILSGGLLVRVGQSVDVGQQIAKVGMTGGATGCHLHYGVRINGVVTNPVPFMRKHGITLG
jgi:murein DD-endopeptidase MepM/ murein hydrolase activator NlpD